MKASSITDIIAVLPVMLGSVPEERIVMVVVKDGQVYGVMAVGLPDGGDEAIHTLDMMVERAEAVGADVAFLVIHASNVSDHAEAAYGMFALGFGIKCERLGIKAPGMALVSDTFWRDYADPEQKRDLAELASSQLAAELVHEGHDLKPAEESVPAPDLASASVTLKALNFRAGLPTINLADLDLRGTRIVRDAWALWITALATGELTERTAADLIGYFQHLPIRDAFIAYLVGDEFEPTQYEQTFNRIMHTPDPAWLPRAKRIAVTLRELLRWTEGAQRPNILAMTGFVEWFMGRGTTAELYYDAARAIEPDHRMTHLLSEVARRTGLSKAIQHPDSAQYAGIIND